MSDANRTQVSKVNSVAGTPITMLPPLSEPPAPVTVIDIEDGAFDPDEAADCLRRRGFVILRNLFPNAYLDDVVARMEKCFERPAIAGAMGYWKFDHAKKTLNPFMLGGNVVPMMLDERVIDFVEAYMASDCVLAEVSLKFDKGVGYEYFPLHSDFSPGWKKTSSLEEGLTEESLRDPVGVGGAIYLHDTSDGAFTYCEGTHDYTAVDGPNLSDYPSDIRQRILERRVRCDGQKGDLVIFDDRGFHGPDQPTDADRVVILLDYYRVETHGFTQVSPMPVWTSDLGGLSDRQLRVLGVGASYAVDPTENRKTQFKNTAMYSLVSKLVEYAYLPSHVKHLVKARLKRSKNSQINS